MIGNYPARAAELYPATQTQADVIFAVDAVTTDERAGRYFGADLLSHQILPVAVLVTNRSRHRVIVRPGDVLMHLGDTVIDPLPPRLVAGLASGEGTEPDSAFARYFDGLSFKETMVEPGESYHGVMFFALPESAMGGVGGYTTIPVFSTGGLQLVAEVRDMETRNRLRFGPFSLSLPPGNDDP
jgi:hypothetical protein